MPNKTLYQIRRYTLLFLQHCDDIQVSGDIDKHLQDLWIHSTIDTTTTILKNRITVSKLSEILSYIGPLITLAQAKEFIMEYDSTLSGTLTLPDFLEFIKDFIMVLKTQRMQEIQNYQLESEDPQSELIIEYPTLEDYLTNIGLEDPMSFIKHHEPTSEEIKNSFQILNAKLLIRHISVRIFAASNLLKCARYVIMLFFYILTLISKN